MDCSRFFVFDGNTAHVRLDLADIGHTDVCVLTVEYLRDLLKSRSFRSGHSQYAYNGPLIDRKGYCLLDVEEVDDDKLDRDPTTIDSVKLPARCQAFEADGVDVPASC